MVISVADARVVHDDARVHSRLPFFRSVSQTVDTVKTKNQSGNPQSKTTLAIPSIYLLVINPISVVLRVRSWHVPRYVKCVKIVMYRISIAARTFHFNFLSSNSTKLINSVLLNPLRNSRILNQSQT